MKKIKIAVIGLGYVGLPLARLFATKYSVVGFDINENRITELSSGKDHTLEIDEETLKAVLKAKPDENKGLFVTEKKDDIKDCNYYIVTVPSPIDSKKNPDLRLLYKASETVGEVISKGDIVVYESTVYPGATEEELIPVIEKKSGLVYNTDFFAGYSPERINPGDKNHTVEKITKVTSGSTPEIAILIDNLYASVIDAGTYSAPSIRIAEAAKAIENSQRDINIAFINELKKIFDRMNIDTDEVLKAASTKWNFLNFKPGLVGGHCIGVDPYYLAHKAQEYGYHPEMILAGRRLNDTMSKYVANEIVKKMVKSDIRLRDSKILVLGITFKENCTDVRNTKVVDVIKELNEYQPQITIYDPWANAEEVKKEYDLNILNELPDDTFDAIILAVKHKEFQDIDYNKLLNENGIIYGLNPFT